jgi:HIND motif
VGFYFIVHSKKYVGASLRLLDNTVKQIGRDTGCVTLSRFVLRGHPDRRSFSAMSMEESISLEETNKIRISLGLKPLKDDNAPADKDKQAQDNYEKQREQEAKDKESK